MSEKPWKIEYFDETWLTSHGNNISSSEGVGFFKLTFNDFMYGCFSKDAFSEKNTGEILALIEAMLNDAHSLALKGETRDPILD